MIEIEVPFKNTIRGVVGDIYVKVDIRFQPWNYPYLDEEKIVVNALNTHLQVIGAELAVKIEEWLKEKFKSSKNKK